jgi:hypothetical protein
VPDIGCVQTCAFAVTAPFVVTKDSCTCAHLALPESLAPPDKGRQLDPHTIQWRRRPWQPFRRLKYLSTSTRLGL